MRNTRPCLSIALTGVSAAVALACGGSDLTLPSEGRPASLAVVDGNNQTASGGQPLPNPLVVRVMDSDSRPVPQTRVAFVVTAGGGTTDPDTATTGSDGRAVSRWTLGTAEGVQAVEARVAGSDAIKARFNGTAGPQGPALTTTQITSVNPSQSFPTQPVVVGFLVTANGGSPTGMVLVSDGTVSCTASAPGGQCSLTPPTAGTKTLTARYAGSATFAPSSGTAQHDVILARTSSTLSSSKNPSKPDDDVTFSASVTSTFGTPSGSVLFVEGSCNAPTRTWGADQLDDAGRAKLKIQSFSVGTHIMFACYLGSGTFAPSASNVIQQEVIKDGHG
jgi:Bacterial Ig-like domain (group 3)